MRTLLAILVLLAMCPAPSHAAPPPDDPALWLEDVTGDRAMEWVKARNDESVRALAQTPEFEAMRGRFLDILDSKARIPTVNRIGDLYYNFWRDAEHPRGLWRRTTLEEYRKESPAWEPVLDLDALGAAEKMNWVWHGAEVLYPGRTRCLVALSRGGGDAEVVREFDLTTKAFVPGGFELPESKSSIGWIDRDHVYVGFAFDSTTMTTSGYPRIVKVWTRGTPLAEAVPVFEVEPTDVAAWAYHDPTPGFERDFAYRAKDFFTNQTFLLRDGNRIAIEKPDDADVRAWREWILFSPRSAWTVGGRTWPAGTLLIARFDDWIAGRRELQALFEPTERASLAGWSQTRSAVLLEVLDNVRSRLYSVRLENGAWVRTPLPGVPEFGSVGAAAVDAFESDEYWLNTTDFLTPGSLGLGTVGGGPAERLKQNPAFFDASRSVVSQHEAVSKDGTRIPYFEVAPKDLRRDGSAPTLLTGYGGFEVPSLPYYSGVQGSGWIERGGVLVLANIRGGGEFGPRWHQAALKEKRHKAYEDFIAVGEDLVRRKVTSPRHLGCIGGSNGGLLVGNMLTRRPDLWGAIVCESPLLDMRRYHKLLAGASWMSEYGDPDDPKQWAFIRTFSPYHNLKKGVKYPPLLFTSSTRDDRVHPGHARKMVLRMRDLGLDPLYYENIEGGHSGSADNKQRAFMSALAYTFAWRHLAGGGAIGAAGH